MEIQDTYDLIPIANLGDSIVLFATTENVKENNPTVVKVNYFNRNYVIEKLQNLMKFAPYEFIDQTNKEQRKVDTNRLVKCLSDDTLISLMNDMSNELKSEDIKKSTIDSDIFKAKAQIGEIRVRGDGKRYKKVLDSGDSKKDWKLVTDSKGAKQESTANKKVGKKELSSIAKETSETSLNNAIKESDNPDVRVAAHEELERRKQEEAVQESKENKEDESSETKESLIKELKSLREEDIDYSDEKAFDENLKKQAEVKKKLYDLQNKKADKRKESSKDITKGFKTFENLTNNFDEDKKRLKTAGNFYNKNKNEIEKYKKENKEITKSLNYYISEGYVDFRKYLSGKTKDSKIADSNLKLSKNISEMSDDVSVFISENKITENVSLNRRVHSEAAEFFKGLSVGEIYKDDSFSSTSLIEQTSFGDYNIQILAKKGSSVANVGNEGELEYLIDKDSQFKVVQKTNSGIVVELL